MTATLLRADARAIPLPDASVDLVCTSPPYWALRSYTDAGQHYDGQIGAEPTPAAYIDSLIEVTRELVRVLKPGGSIFVNLGDKYNSAAGGQNGTGKTGLYDGKAAPGTRPAGRHDRMAGRGEATRALPPKSLILLPERYRIRCVDELGLTARAVIIWNKPNGLPESVTDRVRRSHEGPNPLGKLPGSVWTIPTQPLTVPDHLGVDHFAAYPMEWPRRIIQGWSPSGVCTACGEGRRPVVDKRLVNVWHDKPAQHSKHLGSRDQHQHNLYDVKETYGSTEATITGEVCACTPYTDHPGTGERLPRKSYGDPAALGQFENPGGGLGNKPRTGPWREYHLDQWTPPPTRPAVILDPFAGTGTTVLVADVLGRHGIGLDLSADYLRLAQWRVQDPGQRAAAMQVEKPRPELDGQDDLLTLLEAL